MFILTPFKASFLASREYCLELGGDLVTDTMGTSGSKYHEFTVLVLFIFIRSKKKNNS